MLKIGTWDDDLGLWRAAHTQHELAQAGIESEWVVFSVNAPREMKHALLGGAIDLSVHSMTDLPTSQSGGVVITAVSRRFRPSDLLLVRKASCNDTALLKLMPDARVSVLASKQKAQLAAFRPDLHIETVSGGSASLFMRLQSADYDALILPAADVDQLGLKHPDILALELPPQEFVPNPGQGVIAWVCNRDDLNSRQLLKKIHHTEVSACTNIERRVLQHIEPEKGPSALGVFCQQDAAGNYHAFAVCETKGELRRARLSSSTRLGLAEKLVQALV